MEHLLNLFQGQTCLVGLNTRQDIRKFATTTIGIVIVVTTAFATTFTTTFTFATTFSYIGRGSLGTWIKWVAVYIRIGNTTILGMVGPTTPVAKLASALSRRVVGMGVARRCGISFVSFRLLNAIMSPLECSVSTPYGLEPVSSSNCLAIRPVGS